MSGRGMNERTNEASKGGGAGPAKTKMAKEGRKQGAPGLKRRGFLGTEPGSGGDPAGLWGRRHGRSLVLEAGPRRTLLRQGLDGGAVPGGGGGVWEGGHLRGGAAAGWVPGLGGGALEARLLEAGREQGP